MIINWPIVIVLFCLSLPGVLIAVPRLLAVLLPNNSEELRKRVGKLAIGQTLFMLMLMNIAGSVLSLRTGFTAPILDNLLLGRSVVGPLVEMLPPVLFATLVGLLIFFILYYAVVASILDEQSLKIMWRIRAALSLDGCILYGAVVEEIIARWGLMNVIAFFAILFAGQLSEFTIWISIITSGILLALLQLPAYFAAGCLPGRRFIYAVLILTIWQAIIFGWLFWHYGLVAAIISHTLFHLGWYLYDRT
ncbi:CPBP family intramembrane metalloprotease [Legionella jordanis]|uniref:CAAX amino terminal protease self-immunity n=1 Tax=Legionella jordanis TaxID=456 RepID=A0A0W0VDJ6_9GAMM|nr:CPBP family intramembrane metalloprotease [Legionella jordanis]KTD18225.1 hypothetical protein Ljor_2531 [Legionella jordanis]RMX01183.1 CPBP family intramembrane metalloprotease [Legionella jordanis]RMX21413.1 CPBP family intramembrane metalloprotease [Legionella jordanis]VEH13682.1 Uncharacterised protein [Legionella jordanis]HAT8714607.1 CPBP family intramembrane metalloprotease [Legionella jordanis]